jgi:hypothetical protein
MQNKESKMDDLTPFVTGGMMILDSQAGDLKGDGSQGLVLVTELLAADPTNLGNGPARETVLLVRDETGQLRKVASNVHVVPSSTCGGLSGDPYGYTRIEPGRFTIANSGGGREQWSEEFTFSYLAGRKQWLLTRASLRVEDRETGRHRQIDLVADDFGDIAFPDFDPAHLPEADLT